MSKLCLNCSRNPVMILAPIVAAGERVGSISLCEDCFIETAINGGALGVGVPPLSSGRWSENSLRVYRQYLKDLREDAARMEEGYYNV